eukprot:FR738218.1.p1 GENE.FR738218.1~~FR738218.1.p1  ORF type:complete len:262 (+),score=18.01 FR738218.1:45-788(+)
MGLEELVEHMLNGEVGTDLVEKLMAVVDRLVEMIYIMCCTGFVELMEQNDLLEPCRDWLRGMRLLPLVLLCMISGGTRCACTDMVFTVENIIGRSRSQVLYLVEMNNPPMSLITHGVKSVARGGDSDPILLYSKMWSCFTSHWWELYSGFMFPLTRRGAGKPTTKTASRVAALKRILKNEPWDNHGSNGLRYYQMVVRDGKTLKRNHRSAIDHELCKWKMVGKHGFPERLLNRIMREMENRKESNTR